MCRNLAVGGSAAILLSLTLLAPLRAENWPRFRGPNGAGVSAAKTVPRSWTEDDFNWTAELPGAGHASPVVWGERIFVTSADAKSGRRYLLCFDADSGRELWRRQFAFSVYRMHGNNSFATSTPCCDAQHVYSLWQSPGDTCSLVAHSHAGEEVWQADLGSFKGGHGPGVSPIVDGDLVVLANDQGGASSLLALEAATGEVRWKVPRESSRTSYSTPCVFDPKDREPELIFTDMHHGITAVDPATGRINWEISVFGTFKQRAIASPVVTDELVIGLSGFTTAEKNAVAVRPEKENGSTTVQEVWRVSRAVPHLPTPVVYQGRMFMWTDRGGIVTCIDAASGDQIWQKRIGGNFSGSPVCIDGNIYCADDEGVVYVIAAGDTFKLLGESKLGRPTRATPAVARGAIYWRTYSHLISLGGNPSSP